MGRRGESLLLCYMLGHAVAPAQLSAEYLYCSRIIASKQAQRHGHFQLLCCTLSHALMPAQLSAEYLHCSRVIACIAAHGHKQLVIDVADRKCCNASSAVRRVPAMQQNHSRSIGGGAHEHTGLMRVA